MAHVDAFQTSRQFALCEQRQFRLVCWKRMDFGNIPMCIRWRAAVSVAAGRTLSAPSAATSYFPRACEFPRGLILDPPLSV